VVYSSLTTWSYDAFTVDEDFRLLWEDDGYYLKDDPAEKRRVENMIAGDLGKLDNLTALQCINEYAVAFQTRRRDVLLIVEVGSLITRSENPHSLLHRMDPCDYLIRSDYDWICGSYGRSCFPCRSKLPEVRRQYDNWIPWGNRVKYCLSLPVKEMCRLNFDFQIAVVILAVNFIKATTLVFIALRPPKEPFIRSWGCY
jgi:hypothetical protein